MIRRLVVLVTVLCASTLTSSCSMAGAPEWDHPVTYMLQVSTPRHYDAWVKPVQLEASGDRAWWHPIGITGCCWNAPGNGNANLDPVPDYIHVTWYSFAEQQSYTRLIHIPDPQALRERMEQPAPIQRNGKTVNMPRDTLVLGLAPGGTVVLWIMNWAETAIEVARYQAVAFDDDVRYEGALEAYLEREGDYLEENGLQLDRW